ncbi:MAG: SRPBCC family protein [Nitriliruptorales bacterium]|nr:SRPBCC family protein [Nitriliruptorales bacterium]
MTSWESSTFIARPAEEVFAYVADVRNDPHWHKDVKSATVIRGDDPVGKGTVFDVDAMVSGIEEIIEYDPPRRVVLKGGDMGKMEPTDIRTITPGDGGVTFTRRVELEASGFMGLMSKLMVGMARKRNDGFVENLKNVLEGQ